jgi:DNA-binding GntR family transcriptional regulator
MVLPGAVGKVPRLSLADQAYSQLVGLILRGALRPGDPLRLSPLVEQLAISQTPLREALSRLEGLGLVNRSPMRGYTVAPLLSAEEFLLLSEARLAVEPQIAASAAASNSDLLPRLLKDNLSQSRGVDVGAGYDGVQEYFRRSAEFHELLAAHCGNRFLSGALAALPVHVQRFRLFGDEGVDDVDASVRCCRRQCRSPVGNGGPHHRCLPPRIRVSVELHNDRMVLLAEASGDDVFEAPGHGVEQW